MRQLSDNEITALYQFTREHFVEHYDVQTELVDHMANDIEAIWRETPSLSFTEARNRAFKKFGVFGFMGVVEEKQKQMNKKYFKLICSFAKAWFQLPKLLSTVTLFLFFYYSLQYQITFYLLIGVLFVTAVLDVYFSLRLKRIANKRFKQTGKKWMLEDYIFNTAALSSILIGSNLFNFYSLLVNKPVHGTTAFLTALILTALVLYCYITLVVIPKKSEELLTTQYPEYKMH